MKSKRLRGYTLIEVAVALAVLAVGAAGVIAIQKATGLGSVNARNVTTANRIASKWAERLQSDALSWNTISGYGASNWLKEATLPAAAWKIPAEVLNFGAPDADVLGADIYAGDNSTQAFCTHLRLTALPGSLENPSGGLQPPNIPGIRAEIRVFWSRKGQPVNCGLDPNTIDSSRELYGFVYQVAGITAPQ